MMPLLNLLATLYFPPGDEGELRERGFRESLGSWYRNLEYKGPIQLVVVNDGPALQHFREWPGQYLSLGHRRNGVGASWNQGLRRAFADSPLVLNIDDDWLLTGPYDLTPWAKMLLEDDAIGCVHLAPYPGTGGIIQPRPHGWVVLLDRHDLAAGLRAALYHKRYFEAYGPFDEGLSAWETERLYNERFCGKLGPETVLALPLPWAEGLGAAVEMGQRSPKEA